VSGTCTGTVALAFACFAVACCVAGETDLEALKRKLGGDHNWMMWASVCALSPADRAYLEPELELLIRHYTHVPDTNWSNQGEWGGWSGFPNSQWYPNFRREWGVSHACGWSPVSRKGTPLYLHGPPGAYVGVKTLFPRVVELFRKGRHGDAARVIGAASHAIQDSATFPHMQAIHRAAGFDVSRIAIPGYKPRLLADTPEKAAKALARDTEAMVHWTEKLAIEIRKVMASGDGKRYSELRAQCCNEAAKVVADFVHTAVALAGPRPKARPHPFSKNLVVNGNVETADFGEPAPKGWVAWHNDRKDRLGVCDWEGRVTRNQNLWRSGRRSLKLMWAPKKGLEWRQTWPCALFAKPGEQYRARVWLRTVDAAGQSGVALQFARRNAEIVTTVEGKSVGGTSDWVQLAVEAAVPEGAERLRVVLFSRENQGAVWFDDIELMRVDPKAKPPSAKPKVQDLVLHLTFDDGKGVNIADRSPYRGINGPNPGISGGVPTDLHVPDGRFGQAVAFDGADDFVECPASYIQDVQCPKGAMTLSLWVFANEHRDATFVAKEHAPVGKQAAGYRLMLRKDGRVAFVTHATKGDAVAASAAPIPLRQWLHVAAVRTASHTLAVYVNGKPGKSVVCPGPSAAMPPVGRRPSLYLGATAGVRDFFAGRIDELALLRRALSAEEIAARAKGAKP
jgi:hypothetical protein